MHHCLCNEHGLSVAAQHVDEIRNYIDNLPKTSATFRISHIPIDVQGTVIPTEFMEFLGSWEVHEYKQASDTRLFVNPNYVHAKNYTDVVVECECGTNIVCAYDDGSQRVQQEHNHADDCLSYYRLAARSEMHRKRHEILTRCAKMGWGGKELAPRLGMSRGGVSCTANRHYDTQLSELREQYRLKAGKTYKYLVHGCDVPSKTVGNVYGHDRSTLGRWVKDHDIDIEDVGNEWHQSKIK